ncbi:hypothetical protein [Mycobacterium paraffinicum]|uniref:ESX-1 secretion-associated protein n=1 Tax=Mycobacterium paraffinicum TaxID=53378 RepID=A0ABP8F490_9MYCO|nr:hypothetical protein [Mycobacterium paraffinicum]MCV7311022.1 hypothetical protein [Mycobacterium paraffinicum]
MTNEEELAASLRSTLVVGMAEAAGIRLAPNGEGGLVAALDVDSEDGKWRFVLPRRVCMDLLSQCAAIAAMTPDQAHALAAQMHQQYLDGQAEADE